MILKSTIKSALFLASLFGLGTMHAMQGPAIIEDYNEPRDIEVIDAIYKSDWEKLYIGKPYDRKIVDLLLAPNLDPEFEKMVKVIRSNDQTHGFITYYFFKARTQDKGCVEEMGIAPASRRKGYAKQLLQMAMQELIRKGSDKINIFCKQDNAPALELYKKHDFAITSSAIRGTSWALSYYCSDQK